MADDIAAELHRVQAELRLLQGKLAALSRVVEESILFQALLAFDTAGEHSEQVAAAVRVLRKVTDMETVK
jgi:hypothetical protein